MNEIKELLLQMSFVITPLFVYHIFFTERFLKYKAIDRKWITLILSAISIVLCMSFPIILHHEFRFDLRMIPLMIGIMYGGYQTGIILTFLILGYRLYFGGGMGIYHTSIVLLTILPVFIYFSRHFQKAGRLQRIQYTFFLSLFYSITVITASAILDILHADNLLFYLLFVFIFILASCLTIYLNEMIHENQRLKEQLHHAEKLSALSELTAAFAHEIRNPMQVNRGFLQLMMEEQTLPERLREYTGICLKEVDRANEIITDYLSFAKPELEECEILDVGEQLVKVTNILKGYALIHKVEIESIADHGCLIKGSNQKFKQCLINIVKNGIEAMPNGGLLKMICRSSQDGQVQVIVSDNGVGMSRQQIKRLGTPFYSLKEKGTGLGLMVCFRIIESFQGSIHIESELGKGTQFVITIPNAQINDKDEFQKNQIGNIVI